jgi:hypothetical protein
MSKKSAASFCHQVAALVPHMFCNYYLVKTHKIANNSATTEAREKISTYLKSLEFKKNFGLCLTKFENCQILLNKICHRFLATTKLFSG